MAREYPPYPPGPKKPIDRCSFCNNTLQIYLTHCFCPCRCIEKFEAAKTLQEAYKALFPQCLLDHPRTPEQEERYRESQWRMWQMFHAIDKLHVNRIEIPDRLKV